MHPDLMKSIDCLGPARLKRDFKALNIRFSGKDIILFLLFPAIITLLMFLPQSITAILTLHIKNPSWWQFFTSSFVHGSWRHYLDNLKWFLTLGIINLAIMLSIKEGNNYHKLLLWIVLPFPIISSIMQICLYPSIAPYISNSGGSSGITAALFGMGFMLFFYYFYRDKLDFFLLDIALLYIALMFCIQYSVGMRYILICLLTLLVFLALFLRKASMLVQLKRLFNIANTNILLFILLILPLILFLAAPNSIFPKILLIKEGMVDFFVHFMGIAYGTIVSFVFFKFQKGNKP